MAESIQGRHYEVRLQAEGNPVIRIEAESVHAARMSLRHIVPAAYMVRAVISEVDDSDLTPPEQSE